MTVSMQRQSPSAVPKMIDYGNKLSSSPTVAAKAVRRKTAKAIEKKR